MNYYLHNNKVAEQYDLICDDFNSSRIRVWKTVKKFLDNCSGSLLDVGVGNGKNIIELNKKIKCIGIDISNKLLNICISKNLTVYKKDVLELKDTDYGTFDNIICIAVIHHIENIELQKQAIINMINCLNKNGNLLISVWSYETINIFNNNDIDTKLDFKKFKLGPNKVEWNSKNKEIKIDRFYYIHNYDTFYNMIYEISKIINIEYTITWELQNWLCNIKLI